MTTSPDESGLPPVPAHDRPSRFRHGALARRRLVCVADVVLRVVVLAVIGMLLIGLVGTGRSDAHFGSSPHTARMQLRNVAQAVDVSRQRNRRLPASLDELTQEDPNTKEPYLDKVPNDPWGVPYRYVVIDARRGRYTLRSAGPDGTFETDDDIVFPEPLARPE